MADDWGHYIEIVAAALFGKPSKRSGKELRFGKQGSFRVNTETGWWDDFEQNDSGGTLKLIEREKGLKGREAIAWMRDELGLDVGDAVAQRHSSGHNQQQPEPPPWDDEPAEVEKKPKAKLAKTYDYTDRDGVVMFQVCRMEPKTFLQRRRPRPEDDPKDIKGGWVWKRDGITQVPYRLPDLIEAIGDDRTIFVVEGEKDVDNLIDRLGVPATCNAGGAGKWPDEIIGFFRGADVVILPDNDPQTTVRKTGEPAWHQDGRPVLPGQDHAMLVADKLKGVARSIRVLPLPSLPVKGDASDWIEAGGTSESLYRLVESDAVSPESYREIIHEVFPPKEFISKFGAVVWGEPIKAIARYEYLIKGLIPRKESVLVYGASQSGKSFLTHDFCMAVARGGDSHGKYCGRQVKRGLVIYCAAEGGTGFIDHRFSSYSKAKNVSLKELLPFVCLTKKFDLFGDEQQLNDLLAEAKHWKEKFAVLGIELELFVIDTLNKVTPAMDEISGKDVGTVMKRLDRIKEELNTGLVLVHHKNAAGTGPRGHTSLYAAFETAIEVGLTGEIWPCTEVDHAGQEYSIAREKRFSRLQKQREGEAGKRFHFYLRGIEIDQDEDGDWRTSCVVEWIDKDQSVKARRVKEADEAKKKAAEERMTEQRRAIYRALVKAIEEYGVSPPTSLGLPKSVTRVVHKEKWSDIWSSQSMDGNPETVRKALARANLWLLNQGYIGRNNDWAWVTGKTGKKNQSAKTQGDNVVPFPGGTKEDIPDPDWGEMNDATLGSSDDQTISD